MSDKPYFVIYRLLCVSVRVCKEGLGRNSLFIVVLICRGKYVCVCARENKIAKTK